MKYKKYTVKTKPEAEDIVCAALNDAGILSLEIEDSVPFTKKELDEIFTDEIPIMDIPEGEAYISFYLEEDKNEKALLSSALKAIEELKGYSDIGEGTVSSSEAEDTDWLNKWKDFFKPFSIELADKKILSIVPSWETGNYGNDSDILLNIDPGTAFGTGAHETTKLCIKELSRYVKSGLSVLDLGTGSGILSMAAFKFGAKKVTATDVDINAKPAIEDNFEKNGLSDADFTFIYGDVLKNTDIKNLAGKDYDIVVANILPVVLVPLCEIIKDFMHKGSVLIFSGILTEKAGSVRQALAENGLEIKSENTEGEWSSITAVWE